MNDLSKLAIKFGTDKWESHFYTQHYDKNFSKFKNEKIKLLEIGVGGYSHKDLGGNSLRMWKEYFPMGQIFAFDIVNKTKFSDERITILQGDQYDAKFLKELNEEYGPFDIIIDDGSHISKHIIFSFKKLFPLLKNGGFYCIEDLQTSYWKAFGGDSFNLNKKNTSLNFLKTLIDGLNYEEFDNPFYEPSYFDKNIRSVQFFHNLAIIYKDKNEEGSNIVKSNRILDKTFKSDLKYFLRKFKNFFTF